MSNIMETVPVEAMPVGTTVPVVGSSYPRKDGPDKVHGRTKYTDDLRLPGMLYAARLTSPHAHAKILSIGTSEARSAQGVRAVVTGKDYPIRLGLYLGDKFPIACDRVRYAGEVVTAVVADSEKAAQAALKLIRVQYELLPPVRSPYRLASGPRSRRD